MCKLSFIVIMALSGLSALAYDAQVNGIYYNLTGDEAEVTYQRAEYLYLLTEPIVFSDYIGKVTIPESVSFGNNTYKVTSISAYAFADCSDLSSISIPKSVTRIGKSAFRTCYFAKDSLINNTTILDDNYWGATLCEEETKDGLLIKDHKVIKCRSWATSVTIPEGVTSISSSAFSGCTSLTSITIPASVTSIGDNVFSGCYILKDSFINNSMLTSNDNWGATLFDEETDDGLLIRDNVIIKCRSWATSVIIPTIVTSIGERAFSGCSSLTSITIPKSVTNIGSEAFRYCMLRNVLVKRATPPTLDNERIDDSQPHSFSQATCHHATLYVPAGCWDAYAFSAGWFWFNNIRETAMAEEDVSEQQAYMLMDAETFAYSVYDPVNDCIGTINSIGSINEDNPYHSWQMIRAGGMHFLYNLGAKKYVKRDADALCLTDEPEPIDIANGDNGLILAGQSGKRCVLVCNESLSFSQAAIDQVTGINAIDHSSLNIDHSIYNMSGQRLSKPQKGLNIVGGRKVLMK